MRLNEGTDLQDVLLFELRMSEQIVRDGHEVNPRFRIFTPSGHFIILLPLSDDASERQRRMRLVGLFMAWKLATGFVLSSELHEPDAISAFGVSRNERQGLMRRIDRGAPISFGETTELGEADIEQGLVALLPGRDVTMTSEMLADLERGFGEGGEMPAMRLGVPE